MHLRFDAVHFCDFILLITQLITHGPLVD